MCGKSKRSACPDAIHKGIIHTCIYMCIGAGYIRKGGRKRKRESTYDEILGEIRMDWSKKYSEHTIFIPHM